MQDWSPYLWPELGQTLEDQLQALWNYIYALERWLTPPYFDDPDTNDPDFEPPWTRPGPGDPEKKGYDDANHRNLAGIVSLGLWKCVALSNTVDIQPVAARDGSVLDYILHNAWDVESRQQVGAYGVAMRLPDGDTAWYAPKTGGVTSVAAASGEGILADPTTGAVILYGAKWK